MRPSPHGVDVHQSRDFGPARARRHRRAGHRDVDVVNKLPPIFSTVDDYIACKILWHVLNLKTLIFLSTVSRRWSQLARQAACWAGKGVYIADLALRGPKLQEWCDSWRLAVVAMTFAQKDSLAGAPVRAHLIPHPWTSGNTRSPWTRIVSQSGVEWLACVTQHRGPEGACVVQVHEVSGIIQHFETPVCLGWTSALNPSGLAIMSDRYSGRSTQPGDLILGLSLLPFGHHPHGRIQQSERELSGETSDVSVPLHFDEVATVLASARLDRARMAIRFKTECDEGECVFACAPISDDVELKFFIATPMDRSRDLPRPRLPRPKLDWTFFESQLASPRGRRGPLPARLA